MLKLLARKTRKVKPRFGTIPTTITIDKFGSCTKATETMETTTQTAIMNGVTNRRWSLPLSLCIHGNNGYTTANLGSTS